MCLLLSGATHISGGLFCLLRSLWPRAGATKGLDLKQVVSCFLAGIAICAEVLAPVIIHLYENVKIFIKVDDYWCLQRGLLFAAKICFALQPTS